MSDRSPAVATAIAIAVVAAIYLFRLDDAAGLIIDDAWYIVLAKALAAGERYGLISSATTPITPVVPPGFPMLLSLVFRINPSYPENLIWLKSISVLAVAVLAVASWLDFTRNREVPRLHAALLVGATILTPAIVFLATSTVMAECVFAAAQVIGVILVERVRRRTADDAVAAVLAGFATTTVIMIRTAGVALAAAGFVYLLLNRRWRQAAIYAAAVGMFMLPWQLYSRSHAPTDAERAAHGGTIVNSYQRLLTTTRLNDPRAGSVSVADMVGRVGRNLAGVATRDIGVVVLPIAYRGSSESGQELVSVGGPGGGSMGAAGVTMVVSLLVTGVMIAGWAVAARERLAMPALLIGSTLIVIAPVNAQTFRYMLPLTPYLLLFLWHGLRKDAVARIALLCVIGFHFLDHASYIQDQRAGTAQWIADAHEQDQLFSWMNANLSSPAAVASSNPGLVYLRTGRKTVAAAYPELNWERWRASGIRYIVNTEDDTLPPDPVRVRVLYRTDRRGLYVVEMAGSE